MTGLSALSAKDLERLIADAVRCLFCGRRELAPELVCCPRCRQVWSPTPLGQVASTLRMTAVEISEASGVPLRTIRRALVGQAVGPRSSKKLAAAFEMEPEAFRYGCPPDPQLLRAEGDL